MASMLFLLLILPQLLSGQTKEETNSPSISTDNLFFEHFSLEDGLSQGSVYAIDQFDGYMWFGTQDGLNRFDGHEFKVLKTNLSLPVDERLKSNWVQALSPDHHHKLWVGTVKGLSIYDPRKENFQSFKAFSGRPHLVDSVSIEKLMKGKDGNMWIMTEEYGVFRYDPGQNEIHSYLSGNLSTYNFACSSDGTVWVSTYNQLYRFDSKTDAMVPFEIKSKIFVQKDSPFMFQDIYADSKGNVWVGTFHRGLLLIKAGRRGFEVSHLLQDLRSEIRGIAEDPQGRIWVGAKNEKMYLIDPVSMGTETIERADLNGNALLRGFVLRIFTDNQGIVWFGMNDSGISKFDPQKSRISLIGRASSLPRTSVFALQPKGEDLFMGLGSEVIAFNRKTKQIRRARHQTLPGLNFEIYDITLDNQQNLWVTTADKGLYKLVGWSSVLNINFTDQGNKLYYLYAGRFLKGGRGLWIGGHNSLRRYDTHKNVWLDWAELPALKPFINYTIRFIKEDKAGNLWIGTLGHGLIYYHVTTQKLKVFDSSNGLSCNNIRYFSEVGENHYIGTDCGMYELNMSTMSIGKHFSESSSKPFQLPNNVIYAILPDKRGHLWISSNKGITKFSLSHGVIKTFDVLDGLQSNEFNTGAAYLDGDGTMYFGGVRGVNYFHPDDLRTNDYVPPVKITSIQVMDSSYAPYLTHLTLPHRQNFISFGFVALNFSSSSKNQYRYILEEVDSKWIHAGTRRTANYTNLPPGNYVFRVIGSNNDGVWNEKGATVKITILPPWWATWWFRTLLILLFAGGVYGLFRYRFAQQLRQREAEIKASLLAQEAERQRFSRELHDSVGANLSLLKMYLSSFGETDIPMAELKERSEKLLAGSVDEIRRLIHDMHPRNLKEMGLAKAVDDMARLVNLGNGLKVVFSVTNVPEHLPEQLEINFFRIVQELLQNAVKHSKASCVWLGLGYGHERLILSYRDDGAGYDTSLASTGNGLLNIRNRVTLLKGEIHVESGRKGTIVRIEA